MRLRSVYYQQKERGFGLLYSIFLKQREQLYVHFGKFPHNYTANPVANQGVRRYYEDGGLYFFHFASSFSTNGMSILFSIQVWALRSSPSR